MEGPRNEDSLDSPLAFCGWFVRRRGEPFSGNDDWCDVVFNVIDGVVFDLIDGVAEIKLDFDATVRAGGGS